MPFPLAFFKSFARSYNICEKVQMRKIILCSGVVAALLGGLWLLQGLGLVNIRPVLCFADCVPVQGPSTTWAIIGALALAVGAAAVFWSTNNRAK